MKLKTKASRKICVDVLYFQETWKAFKVDNMVQEHLVPKEHYDSMSNSQKVFFLFYVCL